MLAISGYASLGVLSVLTMLHLDFLAIPFGLIISILYGITSVVAKGSRMECLKIASIAAIGMTLLASIYAWFFFEAYHAYANGVDMENVLYTVATHWVAHLAVNIVVAIGLAWSAIAGFLSRY